MTINDDLRIKIGSFYDCMLCGKPTVRTFVCYLCRPRTK